MSVNKRYCYIFITFAVVISVLQGCLPVRSVFLAAPDYKDSHRSPAHALKASTTPFSFATTDVNWGDALKVNDWTTDVPVFNTIKQVAEEHKSSAFVIIRNDTVLFEYYNEGLSAKSLNPSYSVAKSFTSALVGIAIQEGHINSIDDPVTKYLPELGFQPYFQQLTIRHLLNHTSGIKFSLSNMAYIYYGKDVWKGINKIKFDTLPGTVQSYRNINTQILGLVLQRVTEKPVAEYLQEKIWTPLGMQSDAFWSTDNKGNTKTYCCLNATALDYAKFGRLYLNRGNWEGQQVINKEWVDQTLASDTTQGSSYAYNRSWYLGLDKYSDFMAIGLYKQHVYVYPEKNVIIVSLARKEDKLKAERVNWWYIFRQLADQL